VSLQQNNETNNRNKPINEGSFRWMVLFLAKLKIMSDKRHFVSILLNIKEILLYIK